MVVDFSPIANEILAEIHIQSIGSQFCYPAINIISKYQLSMIHPAIDSSTFFTKWILTWL